MVTIESASKKRHREENAEARKTDSEGASSSHEGTKAAPDAKAAKAEPDAKSEAMSGAKAASSSAEDSGPIQLGGTKQISVSTFKGKVLVDIREYYTKDGELKPGKKGISLTAEQWAKLKSSIALIDAQVEKLHEGKKC